MNSACDGRILKRACLFLSSSEFRTLGRKASSNFTSARFARKKESLFFKHIEAISTCHVPPITICLVISDLHCGFYTVSTLRVPSMLTRMHEWSYYTTAFCYDSPERPPRINHQRPSTSSVLPPRPADAIHTWLLIAQNFNH